MTSAALLHPGIVHHLVNTLGWPSLRPLQEQAVAPVLAGTDALLLAPTASGKTEAAFFPLLSRMATQDWRGLSVLYVCPLRALLNNLEPRLQTYASWTGRRAAAWHGDTPAGVRKRLLAQPPDILLTTPESLEAMLVSTKVDPQRMFADLRVVVVDEVHSFAGDDRGWHLLGVLARLGHLSTHRIQRLGLSATVGNPDSLLSWLQGGAPHAEGAVVAPASEAAAAPDLELDFVGSIDNAAIVISGLHGGEKRLVFADSRRTVEDLSVRLRARGVETFVSHSSLSRDERHRAESAFSVARDCVIVSTSTLELGIDVGDLDRVIQIGAPRTVASLLQRLGRTGRRAGSTRNALFLATSDDELLRAAALLRLHSEGYVEPVVPPPGPVHVVAQQLLALCLQQRQVGVTSWLELLEPSLPLAQGHVVMDWLLETGHLDRDGDLVFVGPAAEKRYGSKHFLELLSVFTADPQFLVLNGRVELGAVDPLVLTRKVDGPRVLALAGRSWLVTYIDWRRRRVFVEPSELRGTARWSGAGQPMSYAMTDAMRRVLLDGDCGTARLSRRAMDAMARLRVEQGSTVSADGNVITSDPAQGRRWWTWAGARANAQLASAIEITAPSVVEAGLRVENRFVALREDSPVQDLRAALEVVGRSGALAAAVLPVDDDALKQLKFSELLPPELARACLAARGSDAPGARRAVARSNHAFVVSLAPADRRRGPKPGQRRIP